ncbi:MAG TPA: DUF3352 domain-containing protein [Solirubrobacterales bacterium]|jgi:hypothetical protein|nr:DUF3352 domain-containing protein [Solirubrobacterales bacterium]
MIKIRFAIFSVLAVLAALAVAGCGGSSSNSSSSGPASLAAPGSVVFVEGNLRPTGELKSNVNSVASKIAGIGSLGSFIVSEIESSASSEGEPVDFATEVEPWLGKVAGVAFSHLEGGELSEPLIAIQTTNAKATQEFIDKQAKGGKSPYKDFSYEGVDFKVGGAEGNAIGVIGEWLVIADGEKAFKAAVEASNGDSLGGEDRFQTAIDAASNGSIADVYVDVGGLIEQSGNKIAPQAEEILQSSGIDPSEATAVASVIPGSEEIEVDLSSDLGGEKAPSGDVSKLLGSLPGGSFAAFAASGFSEQLEEAVDNLDAVGIPPELPPHKLKSTLSQAGIDLDKIAASLEDAAVFAEGSSRSNLGGALVVTSSSSEAAEAIAGLGTLLRGAKVPGVTAVSGQASGFSVHAPTLGSKPIVVVARGKRIAIGYGLASALRGLTGSGVTLSETIAYKDAVTALGKTPISAFVDRSEALSLAESLVPRSKKGFWEAVPYLKKIAFLALGTGANGELATAKLIAGLEK